MLKVQKYLYKLLMVFPQVYVNTVRVVYKNMSLKRRQQMDGEPGKSRRIARHVGVSHCELNNIRCDLLRFS